MNEILKIIVERVNAVNNKSGFLDVIFGSYKQKALNGAPVVLFGAGALGEELCTTLRHNGVSPLYFCDNNDSRSGSSYCGIPIVTFDELKKLHKDSLIVIAIQKYSDAVVKQLLENGFCTDMIFCKDSGAYTNLAFMYSMVGTQNLISDYKKQHGSLALIDFVMQNEEKVSEAYHLFADQKSKELFISKLALIASDGNFELFKDFMLSFSEPINEFGFFKYEGTPEDYYYFNNDVLSLSQNEVYVDVGAYDGDTVETFVQACDKNQVKYKHIYAFEPDPQCYRSLVKNTAAHKNISCHQLGLGLQSGVLRFMSSNNAVHDQAGAISKTGDIEIQVVTLDDFIQCEEVSFIKMDPGGNIIPDVIKGAANTIAKYKPKLALGAYHSLEAIFEIPLLVKSIYPDYKLYLRHNTFHLSDTALYATV